MSAAVTTFIRRWSPTASLAVLRWPRRPAPSGSSRRSTVPSSVPAARSSSTTRCSRRSTAATPRSPAMSRPTGRPAFLVCNNLPAADARGFVRFSAGATACFVQDTARSYTIDSVAISLTIEQRDSLQPGIALLLYKLPPTVDSTATFAELTAVFTPERSSTPVEVPDTLHSGRGRGAVQRRDAPAARGAYPGRFGRTAHRRCPDRAGGHRRADPHGPGGHGLPDFPDIRACRHADTALQQIDDHARSLLQHLRHRRAVPGADADRPWSWVARRRRAPSCGSTCPSYSRTPRRLIRATLEMVPVSRSDGRRQREFSHRGAGYPRGPGRQVAADPGCQPGLSLHGADGRASYRSRSSRTVALAGHRRPPARDSSCCSRPEASSFSAPVFGSDRHPAVRTAAAHHLRSPVPVRAAHERRALYGPCCAGIAVLPGAPAGPGIDLRRARSRAFRGGPYSAAAIGTGGSTGMFDPESQLSPASLGTAADADGVLHAAEQLPLIDTPAARPMTRDFRFPNVFITAPIRRGQYAFGVGATTYLNRDFTLAVRDSIVPARQCAAVHRHDPVAGRPERPAARLRDPDHSADHDRLLVPPHHRHRSAGGASRVRRHALHPGAADRRALDDRLRPGGRRHARPQQQGDARRTHPEGLHRKRERRLGTLRRGDARRFRLWPAVDLRRFRTLPRHPAAAARDPGRLSHLVLGE